MVKERLFLFLLIMALLPLSSLSVSAETPDDIDLESEYVDPDNNQGDGNRSSVLVPHVAINGYTLTFYTPCDGSMLRLLDESGNVVYSTVIPVGATTLLLPSILSGEYRIEIVQGNYLFWGYLEL